MITTVSVNKSFLDECNGCAESLLEVFSLEVLCFKPQNLQGITFLVAQKDVIWWNCTAFASRDPHQSDREHKVQDSTSTSCSITAFPPKKGLFWGLICWLCEVCAALLQLPRHSGDRWLQGSQGLSGTVTQTSCHHANTTISQSFCHKHWAAHWALPCGSGCTPGAPLEQGQLSRSPSRLEGSLPRQILRKWSIVFEISAKWCKGLAVHMNSSGYKPLAKSETRAGFSCSLEGRGVPPEPHDSTGESPWQLFLTLQAVNGQVHLAKALFYLPFKLSLTLTRFAAGSLSSEVHHSIQDRVQCTVGLTEQHWEE